MSYYSHSRDFVFEFFSKIGDIPGEKEDEKMAYDYVQNQLLDSFGILSLITEIESEFDIELRAEELEDPNFKKVGGLINIIVAKLENKQAG